MCVCVGGGQHKEKEQRGKKEGGIGENKEI